MCGRYTLFADPDDLEDRFDARFDASFSPRYNAAPGQRLPVITADEPRTITHLEWGLVPSWVDDDRNGIVNARAETVAEKPSFRAAYRRIGSDGDGSDTASRGRCLVLADGFYEWADTGETRTPYRVAFDDDRPFAMAGLWERWEPRTTQTGLDDFGVSSGEDADDTGDALETFTILTTEPNALVADLHDRMAVILDRSEERRWMTDDDPQDLLAPFPADDLRAYPVSTAVNDPSTDEPSLVDPV